MCKPGIGLRKGFQLILISSIRILEYFNKKLKYRSVWLSDHLTITYSVVSSKITTIMFPKLYRFLSVKLKKM